MGRGLHGEEERERRVTTSQGHYLTKKPGNRFVRLSLSLPHFPSINHPTREHEKERLHGVSFPTLRAVRNAPGARLPCCAAALPLPVHIQAWPLPGSRRPASGRHPGPVPPYAAPAGPVGLSRGRRGGGTRSTSPGRDVGTAPRRSLQEAARRPGSPARTAYGSGRRRRRATGAAAAPLSVFSRFLPTVG